MVEPRNTGASAGNTSTLALGELHFEYRRSYYAQFEGTAALLRAEGFVDQDCPWPHGTLSLYWEEDGFDYRLRRARPKGLKAGDRSWLSVDRWSVCVKVTDRSYGDSRLLELGHKSAALLTQYQRRTPAGRLEWMDASNRYFVARNDPAFQAFKERIPGLITPKRKAKAATSGAAQ